MKRRERSGRGKIAWIRYLQSKLFMDLKREYDWVDREAFWNVLKIYG